MLAPVVKQPGNKAGYLHPVHRLGMGGTISPCPISLHVVLRDNFTLTLWVAKSLPVAIVLQGL